MYSYSTYRELCLLSVMSSELWLQWWHSWQYSGLHNGHEGSKHLGRLSLHWTGENWRFASLSQYDASFLLESNFYCSKASVISTEPQPLPMLVATSFWQVWMRRCCKSQWQLLDPLLSQWMAAAHTSASMKLEFSMIPSANVLMSIRTMLCWWWGMAPQQREMIIGLSKTGEIHHTYAQRKHKRTTLRMGEKSLKGTYPKYPLFCHFHTVLWCLMSHLCSAPVLQQKVHHGSRYNNYDALIIWLLSLNLSL